MKYIYQVIGKELKDLDKDIILQIAFKAVNNIIGPDGLVFTLLVYGVFPRMTESSTPTPTNIQRAYAIRKAIEEVYKLRAKRQVTDTLNT